LGHWATQKGRKKGDDWAVSAGPRGKRRTSQDGLSGEGGIGKGGGPVGVLAKGGLRILFNFLKPFIIWKLI
jgi:hypothetical protein